jgi:outer membrane receptor protein involved in Fe transport
VPPASGRGDESGLTTDVNSPSADLAGYALADYRVGRVTVSGGARYDYVRVPFRDLLDSTQDATSSYRRFSPRAGVSIDAGGGGSAYASVGQSFRAPAILELACADPDAACPLPCALGDDPPLDPVNAITYEIGGRWARGLTVASASLYRTDVRDEIFFVGSPGALMSGGPRARARRPIHWSPMVARR